MNKILIIEDDPTIRKGLRICLEEEHYQIDLAEDGLTGLNEAMKNEHDLIILDLMLPEINGMDICKKLRQDNIKSKILMLTSKREETDIVMGLEMGADDYLTKPFGMHELKARVKALLRRLQINHNQIADHRFGKLSINFKKMTAFKGTIKLKLTAKEFELLQYFINHEGDVISRDVLLDDVWGYDVFPTTRTIDTFILNLRKKIEIDPSNPKHLVTVHKVGYKFVKSID